MTQDSIMLGYLHGQQVYSDFMHSVLGAIVYDMGHERHLNNPGGWTNMPSGPNVAGPRNNLVGQFLGGRADWLLCLDTDIVFPPHLPAALLASAKANDARVMSGLYWGMRNGPDGSGIETFPVAFGFRDEDGDVPPLTSVPEKAVKVGAVGAGCLLVHRQALWDVLNANFSEVWPWFQETDRDGIMMSEDVEFCLRLQECGYDVWLDPNIEVGHVKSVPLHSSLFSKPIIKKTSGLPPKAKEKRR